MRIRKNLYEWCLENGKEDMLDEWDYEQNDITPKEISYGNKEKVYWICKKEGHPPYPARINNRTSWHRSGCPVCAGKKVIPGINDLSSQFPEIAALWHPTKNGEITPEDITPFSNNKYWWICPQGHDFPMSAANYLTNFSEPGSRPACPTCRETERLIRVVPGVNDIETRSPFLILEWHPTKNIGLKPSDVVYGSGDPIWWICSKGHEWQASPNRRSGGSGCPICSNNALLTGYNDLETVYPELAKEWNYEKNGDLKPSQVKARYYNEVWWKCDKGHEWQEAPYNRTLLGQIIPCKICRKLHPIYKGEKAIQKELQSYGVEFQREFVILNRGRYRDDFAIFLNGKLLATIEYNGEQHYELVDFAGKGPEYAKKAYLQTVSRDQKKREWLIKHQIPQLIVPYWDYDRIPDIVCSFLKDLKLIA